MCGTASWEWEENRFAYEAVDSFCHGCYQKSIFSDTGADQMPGTTVSLVPVTEYHKAVRAVAMEKMQARENRDRESHDGGRTGPDS